MMIEFWFISSSKQTGAGLDFDTKFGLHKYRLGLPMLHHIPSISFTVFVYDQNKDMILLWYYITCDYRLYISFTLNWTVLNSMPSLFKICYVVVVKQGATGEVNFMP